MKQKLEGKLSDCFEMLLIGRIDDSIKKEINMIMRILFGLLHLLVLQCCMNIIQK